MRYSVEHGHVDSHNQWASDYPPMNFDAESLVDAEKHVETKFKEGHFEAWKGGSCLRVWGNGEEAICSFNDDLSPAWSLKASAAPPT
jgi:hypothetical protein